MLEFVYNTMLMHFLFLIKFHSPFVCRLPILTSPKTPDTVNISYARIRFAGQLVLSLDTVHTAKNQSRNRTFVLVICMPTLIPTVRTRIRISTKRKMKKKLNQRKRMEAQRERQPQTRRHQQSLLWRIWAS